MPVAQASDGVPLCLLGKRSRIALNPEPRQFLRFFDLEAETIETGSLRHGAALPGAVRSRIQDHIAFPPFGRSVDLFAI
jgi:hypothetical protein